MSAEAKARSLRRQFNRTGRKVLGKCVFAERSRPKSSFSRHLLRLREIEKIITTRYGATIPETDDADVFIEASAYALNAHCHETGGHLDDALHGWCARWAPWALPKAGTIIREILNKLVRRKYDKRADEVAISLNVKFAERSRLKLCTIGAADLPRHVRRQLAKEQKKERDRLRQQSKRRAHGAQARSSWLAQHNLSAVKPWETMGISRRTYYRRFGTDASLLGILQMGDALVPNSNGREAGRLNALPGLLICPEGLAAGFSPSVALVVKKKRGFGKKEEQPSVPRSTLKVEALAPVSASSSRAPFDADNANDGAEPRDLNRVLGRIGGAGV